MLNVIWTTIFVRPIVNSLLLLYSLFGNNLGWAIIALTLILRLALYPLMKSQFESARKIKQIQPELQKIQKKFARNPKKAQEEQVKLYRKIGYNPLGCLATTLLPLPILIALYQAINVFSGGSASHDVYNFVRDFLHLGSTIKINTQFFFWNLSEAYLPLAKAHGYLSLFLLPYLALAILTGVSQYFSVQMSSASNTDNKKSDKEAQKSKKKDEGPATPDMMNQMNKSMALTFPIMTGVLALSVPAGLSLYWAVQSWATVGLQYAYNKIHMKKSK